ncbi:MAG: type VI secretion system Vgr family protein [Pseudomonadota bacterium]
MDYASDVDAEFDDFFSDRALNSTNRPLRLRLSMADGVSDSVLLPQRIHGVEGMCAGIEYHIQCVASRAGLDLTNFIGLPAELQLVSDRGGLHSICGIVTEASAGQSDGGLATYQLVMRDALAVMDMSRNTRVFLGKNEVEIIDIVLGEWQQRDARFACAFDFEFAYELKNERDYPRREFTMQYDESDAAFVRRLLKRRGIAWFIRPGLERLPPAEDDGREYLPKHTLVMFGDAMRLKENAAGTVRYHRADATEERDTITAWCSTRKLVPGSATGFSWDYADPIGTQFMARSARNIADQGLRGSQLAAAIDAYRIDTPHIGENGSDHHAMVRDRMARHEFEARQYHGEGSVREQRVGEWNTIVGHAELDRYSTEERSFVTTSLRIVARNNLPKHHDARIGRLFARSGWADGDATPGEKDILTQNYRNAFTCVRRASTIVPAFDPRVDVPRARMQSAIVVGPQGEAVHCDKQGRVKVRFPATRPQDHAHAHGAGASDTDADSAWVRVASNWAGAGPGNLEQFGTICLPRPGSEVLVAFVNDDPDKPIIVDQLFNMRGVPPALSRRDELPGSRFLSGMRSLEERGARGNQLRFDDTLGQISAQLASDHATSELNLGWLTEPRTHGRGEPRGEGAELRTDETLALRAAKGLLLSAWRRAEGQNGATGKQLARAEYAELMRECGELFSALGKYAAQHQALPLDDKAQDALRAAFTDWENESNTAPRAKDGGAPLIGITSPAGIGMATAKSIVSYAATNSDIVAQQHLQMTAGQRFNLNAGKGISLFSHHDGIKAIAHTGKLLLQSQHDDTDVNADANLTLTATNGKLTGMAKSIELISEDGSFIKIGKDGITLGSASPVRIHAPDFAFDGPATLATVFPKFGSGAPDLKFSARYYPHIDGGLPAPNLKHKIESTDGSNRDGANDAEGKSELLRSDAMHIATIDILNKFPKK